MAAVAMRDRSIDLSDESYYLLSYRWWDTNLRTFSGAQYIYGPLFSVFGDSVEALRLARLVSVISVHGIFAWAFARWLRLQRPWRDTPVSWIWAAGSFIVACGGVLYGWLPLSPGYNDVSVLGTLGLLACLLSVAVGCERDGRIPLLPIALLPTVLLPVVLAKSVGAVPATFSALVLLVVIPVCAGATGRLRAFATAVAAMAVTLLSFQFVVISFGRIIPPMLAANRLVAAQTNSPFTLAGLYLRGLMDLALDGAWLTLPAALPVLLGLGLWRWRRWLPALALAGAGPMLACCLFLITRHERITSGGLHLSDYTALLVALVGFALALRFIAEHGTLLRRIRSKDVMRERSGAAVVVLAIAAMPVLQGLGTGNYLQYAAVNQFACWAALLTWAVGPLLVRGDVRALAMTIPACTLVAAGTVAVAGQLYPYRADSWSEATTTVGGSGPLSSLRVSAQLATRMADIRSAASSVNALPQHPAVLPFDELPGLVLLLDGRPVGEAWYSASDHIRTRAGIRASCDVVAKSNAVVVVFAREPQEGDRDALRTCGVVLTDDPRAVPVGEDRQWLVYSVRVRGLR